MADDAGEEDDPWGFLTDKYGVKPKRDPDRPSVSIVPKMLFDDAPIADSPDPKAPPIGSASPGSAGEPPVGTDTPTPGPQPTPDPQPTADPAQPGSGIHCSPDTPAQARRCGAV